ncbi:PP2C family serine/threonine-protein phosphatase [Sphingomonas sp. 3P27F8]|uniref:PP2C family serine/threonine-protein phosphatase n=1 Tax=Sphingomonas sp. 3P27F8 TaxID=2502213 RepID=UPI0010F73FCD|nr:PP2C family serine/threonine-protein phosphatase [Sphingomonas sp. 3P27F8]
MPGWTWAGASQRGTAHAQAGEHRQDAFCVLAVEPGYLIAVVCDGAGSTKYGGLGAAIAARVLTNRAADWIAAKGRMPTPSEIELWVAEVRLMIIVSADRLGCAPSQFAATLVLAVSDGTSAITAHIGDGAIVARPAGDTALVDLSWPDSGEYASTTYFLTDASPRLRISVINHCPIDRLALLTDGLERLALDFAASASHRPFFDGLFSAVAASNTVGADRSLSHKLAAWLDSADVNSRTDDDKTLILASFG